MNHLIITLFTYTKRMKELKITYHVHYINGYNFCFGMYKMIHYLKIVL